MAFGGLDFGFGGSNFGGTAAGADASTGAAGGGGSSRVGAPMGDSAMDYEELLRDMPPKEILPDPIATKVALTPAPLTTQPPVFTKPPESEWLLVISVYHALPPVVLTKIMWLFVRLV